MKPKPLFSYDGDAVADLLAAVHNLQENWTKNLTEPMRLLSEAASACHRTGQVNRSKGKGAKPTPGLIQAVRNHIEALTAALKAEEQTHAARSGNDPADSQPVLCAPLP